MVICRPPLPGSDVERGRQAYYSLTTKLSTFRADGLRRLVVDNRRPIDAPIRLPVRNTEAIIVTSSPLVPPAPRSPDDSSDVITSSPQPSVRLPNKRKAVVDVPSSPPDDDDDLYIVDPKPKRAKAIVSNRKGPAKTMEKGKELSVKGKGRKGDMKGKGNEREERPPRPKKVKSVAFIEDEDSDSSDDKPPPAARPKPRPAYRGTNGLQGSPPEDSQKNTASIPASAIQLPAVQSHAASDSISATASNPTPVLPVRPTFDSSDGQLKPSAEHAAQTSDVPTVPADSDAVSRPILVVPGVLPHGTDPQLVEGQYPPGEPHHPLQGYAADEHNRYYHGRPLRAIDHPYGAQPPMHYRSQNLGPPRYPGEGDVPPDRYGFRGDYYGYAPHSREYYPPYAHAMQPGVQSPYAGLPPAPYHQHSHHDAHLQPDMTAAPRGPTGNAMASSSRLTPPDHHAKSA